ncbi:MAG: hypothetical protein ACPGXL_08925 [Chitinophagales bacterium]
MFWLVMFILLGFAYGMYVVFKSFTAEAKRQAEGVDTGPTIEQRLKAYVNEEPMPTPAMSSFQQEPQEQQQQQQGFNFDDGFDDDDEEGFDFNFEDEEDDDDMGNFDFGRNRQKDKKENRERERENTFDSLFQNQSIPAKPEPAQAMTFNEKRAAIHAEKDLRNARLKEMKRKRRAAKAALDKLNSKGKFKFSPQDAIIYNVIMNNKYQNIDFE